jgi:hypothetical protein
MNVLLGTEIGAPFFPYPEALGYLGPRKNFKIDKGPFPGVEK